MPKYLTSLETGKDYLLFRTDGEYEEKTTVRDHARIYKDRLRNVRLLGRYRVASDCGGFYNCIQREKKNGRRAAVTVQKNDLISKAVIAVPCSDEAIFPIPEKIPDNEK